MAHDKNRGIMKYFTLLLLAASLNASAELDLSVCKSISESAGKIMEYRQGGTQMSNLMERSDSKEFHKLVIAAYSKPKYSSPKYVKRAVDSFTNDWYLKCVKSI